jgi:hypothetical protein
VGRGVRGVAHRVAVRQAAPTAAGRPCGRGGAVRLPSPRHAMGDEGGAHVRPPLGQVNGRPSSRVGVVGGGAGTGRRGFPSTHCSGGRCVRDPPSRVSPIAQPNWRPGPRGRRHRRRGEVCSKNPRTGGKACNLPPDPWSPDPQRHYERQARRSAVYGAHSGPPAAVRAPPARSAPPPPSAPCARRSGTRSGHGVPPNPTPTTTHARPALPTKASRDQPASPPEGHRSQAADASADYPATPAGNGTSGDRATLEASINSMRGRRFSGSSAASSAKALSSPSTAANTGPSS